MVLVDIAMPDMDGYETIREIRARPDLADLPIVAVTAKAMKGDRQKCIQAGASDYVSKPVDIDQLVSVMRVSISGPTPCAGRGRAVVHDAAGGLTWPQASRIGQRRPGRPGAAPTWTRRPSAHPDRR